MEIRFHEQLKNTIHSFIHGVYNCTGKFPREEIFGLTSQLRRAAMLVMLNYVEGYARQRKLVLKNFLETSYGSLKECDYIIQFAFERNYISQKEHQELKISMDKIGAMLWGMIWRLKS